jgi:hypothetical protein
MNPIDTLTYVSTDELTPAPWRVTYTLKPDMITIAESLLANGWIQPIVARHDGTIIDGHARVFIASTDPRLDGSVVPVVRLNVDDPTAVATHIQLNRGRGGVQAKQLSRAIKRLIAAGWDDERICASLHMDFEEFDLLADGSLIKSKKLAEHKWSPAWIPVEAPPAGSIQETVHIERPPNGDR